MRYSVHWRNVNRRVGHLDTRWVVREATVVALWTSHTPPPELQKSLFWFRVAARVPKERTAVLDRWRVTFADRHRPTGLSPEWLNSTRENSFLQSSGQSKSQVKIHTSLFFKHDIIFYSFTITPIRYIICISPLKWFICWQGLSSNIL